MAGITSVGESDQSLVLAARSGQTQALDELVSRHFGLVYAIALGRLNNREQAEELTQEVFLRVCLLIDRLQDPALFSHWISRITRNLAIDWQRRGNRASRLLPMISLDDVPEGMADRRSLTPREEAEQEQYSTALHEVLARLQPEERELLMLHYMEGLSQGDIAERLGLNKSTVSRHLARSLKRMHGLLDQVLRQMAARLRPRSVVHARVLLITAAATALPPAAKSAMAASAAAALQSASAGATGKATVASGASGIMSLIQAMLLLLKSGGMKVGIGKAVSLVAAAGVIGGGAYYMMGGDSATHVPPSAGAQAVSSVSGPEQFDFRTHAAAGKRVVMRTEMEAENIIEMPEGVPSNLAGMGHHKFRQVEDMSITTRPEPGGTATEFEVLGSSGDMVMGNEHFSYDSSKPLPQVKQGGQLESAMAPLAQALQGRVGMKLTAHADAQGKILRYEGLDEFLAAASNAIPAAMRSTMAGVLDGGNLSKTFENMTVPAVLPNGPVKIGDTWETSSTTKLGALGAMTLNQQCRFAGWEMREGRRVAVIEITGTIGMDESRLKLPVQTQMQMQWKWSDSSVTGKTWVDPELGVVASITDQKHTMEMTMSMPKQAKSVTMKMHTNNRTKVSIIEVSDAPVG